MGWSRTLLSHICTGYGNGESSCEKMVSLKILIYYYLLGFCSSASCTFPESDCDIQQFVREKRSSESNLWPEMQCVTDTVESERAAC